MINVVLFEPEIPQNTGNIMRTCMAFGMNLHLIEPIGFSLDEKHLRRAGMDYIEKLNYKTYKNYEEFKAMNPGRYVCFSRYGMHTFDKCDFTTTPKDTDLYLIFGKESTGIPKEILQPLIEDTYRLPMRGDARSLNLSNCVAIGAYEALRQLGHEGLSDVEVFKGADWLLK